MSRRVQDIEKVFRQTGYDEVRAKLLVGGHVATLIRGYGLFAVPHHDGETVDPNLVFNRAQWDGIVREPTVGGTQYEPSQLEIVDQLVVEQPTLPMYVTRWLGASVARPTFGQGLEDMPH